MRNKLIALVGAGAAALLFAHVPVFEGVLTTPYRDAVNVLTVCAGHTKSVENRRYSKQECDNLLATDLVEHAQGVLRCTPQLKGRTYQLAAVTSFAFNVGVGAYCASTMARKVKAGDWKGACNELPRWVYAGGRKLRGLEKRREVERQICLTGLA